MSLDFDVLVVGGGPGGIAAAMRARWVKRYSVVPCSVAIVDPSSLGGLTQMGTCIMTSPTWLYNEETIRPLLVDDVDRFGVPHIRKRVSAVTREEGHFRLSCSDGASFSARVVVVCAGMKMLAREPELWGNGVTATSMGIEWAAGKVRRWVSDSKHKRVVFVGSEKLFNLIPLARKYRAPQVDLRFVVEPIVGADSVVDDGSPDVTYGTVVEMDGTEQLRAITVEHPVTGRRTRFDDVDLLVVDFLSYEVRPARNFECAGVALDPDGFIAVDRRQRTNVDGLFAAGDVTGMPACVGTAIGEGIVAGFEAYRYVYRQKFGSEPPLFAYYGHDAPLDENFVELPEIPASFGPRRRGSSEHVLKRATERGSPEERLTLQRLVGAVAGADGSGQNVQQLAGSLELSAAEVTQGIHRLLEMKLITLTEVTA